MKLNGTAPLPDTAIQPGVEAVRRARQILDRVGDKWSLVVVHQLGTATKRFTELKREIPGISQRMLTATLRMLERDGLVARTVHPVVPPRVDYALTPLGLSLLGTVCSLVGWAYTNAEAIEKARAAYDAHYSDLENRGTMAS
ncbi:MAG TPA: helix-turn-helix domain-containing protein [Natronosporangium sp.]